MRTPFLVAATLDAIYQIIIHKFIYPLELLFTATLLALVPYFILRGPVNRIARGITSNPIIGNHDGSLEFKIPKRPIRKTIRGLPAFTTVRGGAYFFLPGLKALRYLATMSKTR